MVRGEVQEAGRFDAELFERDVFHLRVREGGHQQRTSETAAQCFRISQKYLGNPDGFHDGANPRNDTRLELE